jgi:F0F1-type ATP synthase assembly protein I
VRKGAAVPPNSVYERIGRLSAIVFILPSTMAAGAALGYFVVDRLLGSFPWGTIVLVLVSSAAGFYQIVRILTGDRRGGSGHQDA